MTLLGGLPRSFATLGTTIEAKMEGVSLDYVQQALIHEEMKQSELSCQSSEAESALTGVSEEVRHATGQHALDVVKWVTFAVIVQTILHGICLRVLNVAVWVIFAVTLQESSNCTKHR